MILLSFAAILCLILSFAVDRQKTYEGCRRGINMFLNLLPAFLTVLFLVSTFLYLVPEQMIVSLLGKNSGLYGVLIAALLGSISLIPGFVAFSLAAILIQRGVSYTILAVFITTLLMVGILTLPVEIRFFGKRAAFTRNILSLIGALIIGLLIGIFYKNV